MYIEEASSGTGLIQKLKRESTIPVFGMIRNFSNKLNTKSAANAVERVSNILSYIAAEKVYLPRDKNTITVPLLKECEEFTRDGTHKHDDIVDTMCDAITMCYQKGKYLLPSEMFPQNINKSMRMGFR
jgi:predicted phage terminase large subunit-like protein